MGFLHKLWDETLAGPTPETGLAKLRKYDSFSGGGSTTSGSAVRSTQAPPPPQVVVPVQQHHPHHHDGVTRSITILRTNSTPLCRTTFSPDVPGSGSGSDPDSPSSRCTTPGTPLTPGTPTDQNFKKYWTRRKPPAADAFERAHDQTSPTIYDWIVISALDR
ncbi:Dormancy/auxin associated family protein [Parasponia andersonii]|uniref:Dormancy/auxin associated family protein n=1 Tax=Parasponia andersonii TaxID=3476 RepID=A0A2P5B8N2_PARAD|nr:Dormancy/auxin associated family protein [Parasponia andersonii]